MVDHAATLGGIDAGGQRLHAFFSNTLSPARQAARVDGQLGLQVGLAANELPVRVSTQVLTTASPEASKVCYGCSSPATRRGGKAGWPRLK